MSPSWPLSYTKAKFSENRPALPPSILALWHYPNGDTPLSNGDTALCPTPATQLWGHGLVKGEATNEPGKRERFRWLLMRFD